MMRAIKMVVAAVGLAGAAVVIAPAPACAQVFWPAFGIVPYYNYYYYYPPYPPAFWGAYGYSGNRPLRRRYHAYGYYRSPAWRRGRRHDGIYGGRFDRHAAVYSPYGFHRSARRGFARTGGGHRWYGSAGFGRPAGGYGSRGPAIRGSGIRGPGVRGVGGVHR